MSTRFKDLDECLSIIAATLHVGKADVEKAYQETKETIHIGFPQDCIAWAFEAGGHRFAIEDFRNGKAIWTVDKETGFMVRW